MSDHVQMIADLNRAVSDDEVNLTEFESGFMERISLKVRAGRDLSDREDEILEEIWKKATG